MSCQRHLAAAENELGFLVPHSNLVSIDGPLNIPVSMSKQQESHLASKRVVKELGHRLKD